MKPSRRLLLTLPLVGLASCTRESDPDPTPTLETPSIDGDSDPTEDPEQTDPGAEEPDADGPAEPPGQAPHPEDEQAVADHARTTMEAFWDTSQPQQEWYANLAATMTTAGGAPFEHTLVENVIPAQVTGDIEVTWDDPASAVSATAAVPSSVGLYTLRLVAEAGGWLTDSIAFPEEG